MAFFVIMPKREISLKNMLRISRRKTSPARTDWWLVGLVFGLTVFGLIMVGNVSVVEAYRDFGDKLYYLRLQLQWAGLGLLAFLAASFFDYRKLKFLALPLLIFTLVCLLLVLIPGLGASILGTRRWLSIGPIHFQPAELAKLTFVLYLSSFFATKKSLLPFLTILGLIVFLIMLEPDLGTTVVLCATGLAVYFASGAPILTIGLIGLTGIAGGAVSILSSAYRRERLTTFLNPTADPLGASYHIRQILIALGSGGLFGVGLGQSRQKYEYLPAVTTDSIFAVIAEELGFIGSVAVLLVFLCLIWRGFRIASRAPDDFGRLLAVGITSWVGFQALVNLGAMVALIPLTGVPLPFISYGGSSLILVLTAMGILINISKQGVARK
ncbi:putative lipid II flippase FtsW [Candidatus Shapirobacteria bacterium CG09_land_8_20_14_0_10_47_13]|uniref:Probable peptidoglycan glycosyltransferase FtsW n=1 Tax=Candidatus Shapirobacteria bacterium CG09_land_8_20_14_0_10_47_13 TaxID=1974481 RepID=A0A2H0WMS8_9BACT|nr:MAG: putative lipid II flippase FtsW [Candidatus Shapirobacteria bacterium CG09_land_8_20_14_0_10_47_13]